MIAFVRKHAVLVVVFVLLLTWGIAAPLVGAALVLPPIDRPMTLGSKSEVRTSFTIRTEHLYELEFVFDRQNHSYEELLGRLGDSAYRNGERDQPGVLVPVSWSVTRSSDGTIAAADVIDTAGTDGWSEADVIREIASFRLAPGRYELHAEVLEDVPELASLKCRLVLEIHRSEAEGFDLGVWMLLIGPMRYVWILTAMAAIGLAVFAFLDRRRARAS